MAVVSQKVGMFCALSQRRIIGPIFFDTSVTSAVYIEMFQDFMNQLDDKELSLGFYQQDGVTCHTSAASMAEIESFFPGRVISKRLWPPRSPDLTPPDFFLWGHLKGRVYMNRPRTLEDLRENISTKSRWCLLRFWLPPSGRCSAVFNCVWVPNEDTSSTCCDRPHFSYIQVGHINVSFYFRLSC
jgi:hypothetical protein